MNNGYETSVSFPPMALKLPFGFHFGVVATAQMGSPIKFCLGWREALRQFTIRWPERIEQARAA